MKNILGAVLILGGLAILAIIWFGVNATSQKSDEERLLEAMYELRAAEEKAQAERDVLRAQVLEAPEICKQATTKIIFDIVEGEPDPGADWPDWRVQANGIEMECIREAFHQTNAHALKIRGEDYVRETLPINRSSRFISDVARAALWTDGIDYGDEDASLYDLINGFYADRAESTFQPEQDY